jgi:hypothetical protein
VRKFLPLLLLIFFAPHAQAISKVQSCQDHKDPGTGDATCTLAGVGANHLLIMATWTCGVTSVVDTFTIFNVGPRQTEINTTNCNLRQNTTNLWSAGTVGHSGSETVTVTEDNTGTIGAYVILEEWDSPGTLDQHTGNFGTSVGAGTISSGNVTTSAGSELLVGVGKTFGAATLTAGSGYTIQDSLAISDFGQGTGHIYIETKIGGAAGTEAGTFAQSGAGTWEVCFATFTVSGAAMHHKAQVI